MYFKIIKLKGKGTMGSIYSKINSIKINLIALPALASLQDLQASVVSLLAYNNIDM